MERATRCIVSERVFLGGRQCREGGNHDVSVQRRESVVLRRRHGVASGHGCKGLLFCVSVSWSWVYLYTPWSFVGSCRLALK
ncbi:hypothetical protein Micbo1qcDRAFT_54790 [Microdochium bolleyi]|uniref:Uncharacterized protein n=1 Tax=Microdochium bolleyi TaxID=196109 RepID=A0A136J857_9PEZI|nr:hypothetical protein Micbo1qcDRAFT_54790 [Microdochium bolleyi]